MKREKIEGKTTLGTEAHCHHSLSPLLFSYFHQQEESQYNSLVIDVAVIGLK